jgi:hypothetical protein
MNIMLIRSQMPALLGAQPAGQHRVCHPWMHGNRVRGTSRATCIHTEDLSSCCHGGSLSNGVGIRARRERPQSP